MRARHRGGRPRAGSLPVGGKSPDDRAGSGETARPWTSASGAPPRPTGPRSPTVDSRNFGFRYSEQDLEDTRLILDVDRFFLALDGGGIVGLTGDYQLDMTVPGGGSIPAAGVTWVSVNTTHRRRGVLTALFLEQHRSYLDEGYAVAILGASESGIYGRFGYGAATEVRRLEIDRRHRAGCGATCPRAGRCG